MTGRSRHSTCVDNDGIEIGISLIALAECAHVLRTQYGIRQRDIIDSLFDLVQPQNGGGPG